jgi:hypothetical protein
MFILDKSCAKRLGVRQQQLPPFYISLSPARSWLEAKAEGGSCCYRTLREPRWHLNFLIRCGTYEKTAFRLTPFVFINIMVSDQ